MLTPLWSNTPYSFQSSPKKHCRPSGICRSGQNALGVGGLVFAGVQGRGAAPLSSQQHAWSAPARAPPPPPPPSPPPPALRPPRRACRSAAPIMYQASRGKEDDGGMRSPSPEEPSFSARHVSPASAVSGVGSERGSDDASRRLRSRGRQLTADSRAGVKSFADRSRVCSAVAWLSSAGTLGEGAWPRLATRPSSRGASTRSSPVAALVSGKPTSRSERSCVGRRQFSSAGAGALLWQ